MIRSPRPDTIARLTALLEQAADAHAAIGRGDRPGPVWIGRRRSTSRAREEADPRLEVGENCPFHQGPLPDGRGSLNADEPAGLPLPRRALHEWLSEAPPQSLWAAAAREAADGHPGAVFWVGPACWPWAAALPDGLRARSVFVNAPRRDPATRVWATDLLLRSPAAAAVVADGRGLNAAASRRLQLAAEAGDALALLWRNENERAPSAAHYRWAVTPQPSGLAGPAPLASAPLASAPLASAPPGPRWRVECLRRKDAAATLSSSAHGRPVFVFDVEWNHAQGLVAVPDPMADRPRAAGATPTCPGSEATDPDRRSA